MRSTRTATRLGVVLAAGLATFAGPVFTSMGPARAQEVINLTAIDGYPPRSMWGARVHQFLYSRGRPAPHRDRQLPHQLEPGLGRPDRQAALCPGRRRAEPRRHRRRHDGVPPRQGTAAGDRLCDAVCDQGAGPGRPHGRRAGDALPRDPAGLRHAQSGLSDQPGGARQLPDVRQGRSPPAGRLRRHEDRGRRHQRPLSRGLQRGDGRRQPGQLLQQAEDRRGRRRDAVAGSRCLVQDRRSRALHAAGRPGAR